MVPKNTPVGCLFMLNLLLFLVLGLRVVLWFSYLYKTNISKIFQFVLETVDEQLLCDHASANAHLFNLLKFYLSTSKLLEKCYARHTYAGN